MNFTFEKFATVSIYFVTLSVLFEVATVVVGVNDCDVLFKEVVVLASASVLINLPLSPKINEKKC